MTSERAAPPAHVAPSDLPPVPVLRQPPPFERARELKPGDLANADAVAAWRGAASAWQQALLQRGVEGLWQLEWKDTRI